MRDGSIMGMEGSRGSGAHYSSPSGVFSADQAVARTVRRWGSTSASIRS